MAELLGFHHVALTVSDRDASAEWYATVLGFEETFREEGEERRACVMRFPGGAYSVGIWAERLTGAAVQHSGAIEIPPGAILNFKDPDGIGLALFWDRA